MDYNKAAEKAVSEFGSVDWDRIQWSEDGTPDVSTDGLSNEEAKRYQDVANRTWQLTDQA